MLGRMLLLSLGMAALIGFSDGYAQSPLTQDPPKKEEPKKEEPKKEEPKKEEPKKQPKEEPKKEEPKKQPKEEPKKVEKKDEKPVGFDPKLKSAPPKGMKKYDEVVTKEAKTLRGIIDVHQIGDKVLFEVPQDRMGKLFMLRTELAKSASGSGGMSNHPGAELGRKFFRFERRENKILVYRSDFDKRAGDAQTKAAVEAVTSEPIIGTFAVEAEGKDRSVVFTATNVFLQDSLDSGARNASPGGSIDSERSFLQEIKAFPANIESRVTMTLRGGGRFSPQGLGMMGASPAINTVLIHYSLIALPDEPMMGRLFDPRVGYFTEGFQEFGNKKGWATSKEFITRYRLEKKSKSADVSEVEQPITFYLAPEIPEKWREYIRQGVEDWKPAFEKAGFKNAIACKDAPKDMDPEDSRYSMIRWVADPVMNAMGPNVYDPRSGEVISAHIIFWQDIVKLNQLWYFIQCSAQDDKARKLPLPDDITGAMIRYVACHEVGHTFGLRHNHRASQAYSIDQLRDPKFCEKHGSVASIMSYGRCNYVAQPEDKVAPKDLLPKVAPYDYFAIEWGYKPVSGASTPDEEKKTLDEWAARQIKEPFLRFGGEDGPSLVDPTVLTENIGSDRVKATELGMKNLDRVLDYIVTGTSEKGDTFELLQETYGFLLSERAGWLESVAQVVGGVVENRTLAGRDAVQFNHVPKADQKRAVQFLLDSAFVTPKKLLKPEIINQFRFSGITRTVTGQQRALLNDLLRANRLNRLLDAEVQNPDGAYTVGELISDVQTGLFKELTTETPKIDPVRRSVQRAFIDVMKAEFQPAQGGRISIPGLPAGFPIGEIFPDRSGELRAVARVTLRDLQKQMQEALPKVKDASTKAHLQDAISEIDTILDTKKK